MLQSRAHPKLAGYQRRQRLIRLYAEGLTFKQLARIHGGTPDGVRSTIRKYREQGLVPRRARIEWPVPRV